MPDAFLETREQGFVVAGIDVDDAVRGETDLGQRGRKEVLRCDAPEDFAACPRRDAGGEKGGGCTIDGRIAAPGDLVQRAKREPPARKMAVDRLEGVPPRPRSVLPFGIQIAKPKNGGWLDRSNSCPLQTFWERDSS